MNLKPLFSATLFTASGVGVYQLKETFEHKRDQIFNSPKCTVLPELDNKIQSIQNNITNVDIRCNQLPLNEWDTHKVVDDDDYLDFQDYGYGPAFNSPGFGGRRNLRHTRTSHVCPYYKDSEYKDMIHERYSMKESYRKSKFECGTGKAIFSVAAATVGILASVAVLGSGAYFLNTVKDAFSTRSGYDQIPNVSEEDNIN